MLLLPYPPRFFSSLDRPSQYLSLLDPDEGTVSSAVKAAFSVSSASSPKLAVLFPDLAERAQADHGYLSFLARLRLSWGQACEGVTAPSSVLEARLRHEGRLLAAPSSRPLRDFDRLLCYLPHPLAMPTLLAMLDLAGLPLLLSQRQPHHPVIHLVGPWSAHPSLWEAFALPPPEPPFDGDREGRPQDQGGPLPSEEGRCLSRLAAALFASAGCPFCQTTARLSLGEDDLLAHFDDAILFAEQPDDRWPYAPASVQKLRPLARSLRAFLQRRGLDRLLWSRLFERRQSPLAHFSLESPLAALRRSLSLPPLPPLGLQALWRFTVSHQKARIFLNSFLGLPGETDDTVMEMALLLREASQIASLYLEEPRVYLYLSPFLPRPTSPWADLPLLPEVLYQERKEILFRLCNKWGFRLRGRSWRHAALTLGLLRPSSCAADLFLAAFQEGQRLDHRESLFQAAFWEKHPSLFATSLQDSSPSPGLPAELRPFDSQLRPVFPAFSEPSLPSSSLAPQAPSFASRLHASPRAKPSARTTCPVCLTPRVSLRHREARLHQAIEEALHTSQPSFLQPSFLQPSSLQPSQDLLLAGDAERPEIGGRWKYRLRYERLPPFSWKSQQEIVEEMPALLFRSGLLPLGKAGEPTAVDLDYGPALPVGMPSLGEYLDLILPRPWPEDAILERLSAVAPAGLRWTAIRAVVAQERGIAKILRALEYLFFLPTDEGVPRPLKSPSSHSLKVGSQENSEEAEMTGLQENSEEAEMTGLQESFEEAEMTGLCRRWKERCDTLLAASSLPWVVERQEKRRQTDLRPPILELTPVQLSEIPCLPAGLGSLAEVRGDVGIRLVASWSEDAAPRPAEIAAALIGQNLPAFAILRLASWARDAEGKLVEPWPLQNSALLASRPGLFSKEG